MEDMTLLLLALSLKIFFMRNLIILMLSAFASSATYSANEWEITGNYIQSVATYLSDSGNSVLIEVVLANPISTGCVVSDQANAIRWWDSSMGPHDSALLSTAMAAMSQGSKVDVRTDTASCSSTQGRPLKGIRIHQD